MPIDLKVEGCEDSVEVDLGDTYLESLGRIVQLDVTVKNVCPGKRVALGVILTEVDANGDEYQRGMKAITIPAHTSPSCRDVYKRQSTNHADAFEKAIQLFDPTSTNAKVIVMFTDGKTTAGPPPSPVAAAARAAGIIIYCIGLVGADGIDVDTLNDWATDPDASHVAVTPNDADLEDLFKDLAANISKPGATDIVIDEIVNSDFMITLSLIHIFRIPPVSFSWIGLPRTWHEAGAASRGIRR